MTIPHQRRHVHFAANALSRLRHAALVAMVVGAASGWTWWAASSTPTAATAPAQQLQLLDRLYFGRAQPDGQEVSEQAWADFLRDTVTPRFPHGLTVLSGQGQWQEAGGGIVHERSYVIELVHADTAQETAGVRAIVAAYKQRFGQESVMWLRQRVEAAF